MSGPFLLARSCATPDETYPTLEALAGRLLELGGDRFLTCRTACVARGPGRMAGICVNVRAWPSAAHVGYAFLPGTLAGDGRRLLAAITQAAMQRIMAVAA